MRAASCKRRSACGDWLLQVRCSLKPAACSAKLGLCFYVYIYFFFVFACVGGAAVFFSFGFLWFSLVFFWFSSGFLLFSLGFLLFSLGFLLFSSGFLTVLNRRKLKKTIRKLKKTIRNATLENRGGMWGVLGREAHGTRARRTRTQKHEVNNRTSALRACVRYKARKAYSGVLRYRPYPRLELKLYLFPYLCLGFAAAERVALGNAF